MRTTNLPRILLHLNDDGDDGNDPKEWENSQNTIQELNLKLAEIVGSQASRMDSQQSGFSLKSYGGGGDTSSQRG